MRADGTCVSKVTSMCHGYVPLLELRAEVVRLVLLLQKGTLQCDGLCVGESRCDGLWAKKELLNVMAERESFGKNILHSSFYSSLPARKTSKENHKK